MTTQSDIASARTAFAVDGVVLIPRVLDSRQLDALLHAYAWSVGDHETDTGSAYFSDMCNPNAQPRYRHFLEDSPVTDVIAQLWGHPDVWFMYEQVFLRHGPLRRTMWHQDLSHKAFTRRRARARTAWTCRLPSALFLS